MSLFSSTHPSHPPPLTPRSPYDVSTFDAITKSLRQHPDLASETDKILNSFQLAKFVDGVRRFQADHLGRKNKSKYWPHPRLPDPIFHTRSISGPLFTAILSAFRTKQSSPWRNFNFDNPKLYDDNISLLKKMERDLITAGVLKRPRVYFDKSVEERCGAEEVRRLSRIAERFGGTVANDEEEISSGKVTHIVAYDPEEHDGAEVRQEEEGEETGEGAEREKKFLRTLGVFDIPVEGEGENVKSRRMALVHWWYFPASYDEWIDADDVSGDVEKENPPTGPGGAAVVGCKFIRDVEKFNEWGVESDYAVMEFERKLVYLANLSNKSTLPANSIKKRRASLKSERLSKKANSGTMNPTDASVSTSTTISEPKLPASKGENKAKPTSRVISDRRSLDTMNPRRIQTGLYGVRGEAIRRTVYDGALRTDGDSYRIIRDALADFLSGSGDGIMNAPMLSAKQEWRKYLPLNALIRPSVNNRLGEYITVTELTASDQAESGTSVTCRKARVLSCPASAIGVEYVSKEGTDPMRIRGGGPDESEQRIDQPHPEGESVSGGIAVDTNENPINDGQLATESAADENNAMEDTPEQLDSIIEADELAPQESTPMETEEIEVTKKETAAETDLVASSDGAVCNETTTEDKAVSSESHCGSPEALPQSTQSLEAPTSSVEKKTGETPSEVASNSPGTTAQVLSDLPPSGNVMTAETASQSNDEKPDALCKIVPLKSSHHLSISIDHPVTSSQEDTAPAHRPSWYDKSKASEFEQRSLPEWFNESSTHRTPAAYVDVRERILDLAKKNGHQFITATALRRSVIGDSGSILRLHKFLTDWGFINTGVGESAPSEAKFRGLQAAWINGGKGTKRKFADVKRTIFWSPSRIQVLEMFVLSHLDKRTGSDGRSIVTIDWERVCAKFNSNLSEEDFVTAKECQCVFLQPPKKGAPLLLPTRSAPVHSEESSISNILEKVRPEVLQKVIDASLNATQDLAEAKKASLVGACASVAFEKGKAEEEEIKTTLMDIVDQRLQRLENRAAMLDDVEALLEAERVALELERRDMYTARCRQWFGDGTS